MTPLAVIDLDIPESGCTGRAFLERDLLQTTTLEELQRAFARSFVDAEDEPRMHLIEQLLRKARVVRVSVHPGESSPPEYHAYLNDPATPETRLFACVLAPLSVIRELLSEPPHVLFETATFQAMLGDVTPSSMVTALEAWGRRVWPELELPKLDVRPWPIEQVHGPTLGAAAGEPRKAPPGAQPTLPDVDYPTVEELSA
jgi:hypothetical protein